MFYICPKLSLFVDIIKLRKAKGEDMTSFVLPYIENENEFYNMPDIKKVTSLIKYAVDLAEENYKTKIDIQNIPIDDNKTFNLISSGDTKDIYLLETEEIQKILKEIRPNKLEDLSAVLALFRPGPLFSGLYDEYKKNKNSLPKLHALLESILENTYGTLIYKEQYVQILKLVMDCSFEDANKMRKDICKKNYDDELFLTFKKNLEEKGIFNGEFANEWSFKFFNYYNALVFQRAYSMRHTMFAYQCAYLKCHYREEFIRAFGEMNFV